MIKLHKIFPAALLVITLAASGAAYPNDAYSDSHKSGKEGCGDHHHKDALWTKLPEKKRKLLHDAMARVHKQNEPLREEIKKQDKELDTLLAAPDFDKNAFLDKSAKLGALHARMKANMSDAFATVMKQFTPEERKILAKLHEMRQNRPRYGEWRHDKHFKEWAHRHEGEPDHKPEAE